MCPTRLRPQARDCDSRQRWILPRVALGSSCDPRVFPKLLQVVRHQPRREREKRQIGRRESRLANRHVRPFWRACTSSRKQERMRQRSLHQNEPGEDADHHQNKNDWQPAPLGLSSATPPTSTSWARCHAFSCWRGASRPARRLADRAAAHDFLVTAAPLDSVRRAPTVSPFTPGPSAVVGH